MFLETLKISIHNVLFLHVFLGPAAVDILYYRQNGPLKNLFSSLTIKSMTFKALICFEKVIIASAHVWSLSQKWTNIKNIENVKGLIEWATKRGLMRRKVSDIFRGVLRNSSNPHIFDINFELSKHSLLIIYVLFLQE